MRIILVFALALGLGFTSAYGATILGTGTGSLLGNDLTDLGDDGVEGSYAPPTLGGFDAEFFSSNESSFGGGENAFNVFDNLAGGGNNKWCCGAGFPQTVGAMNFTSIVPGYPHIRLDAFTLTSSNDSPQRDPRVFTIEGSNDTTTGLDGTWTTIFERTDAGSSDWTARNQVIQYSPGDGDTFLTTNGFSAFRMVTDATGTTGGNPFALSEVELFGTPVPEPGTVALFAIIFGAGFVHFRRRRQQA